MTTAGNDGCGTRTDRYFLKKQVFSFGRDDILPRNLKNRIKSIVKDQELNLESKNWGFRNLTSLHRQSQNQALAQKRQRGLMHANGVLLKAQRGVF